MHFYLLFKEENKDKTDTVGICKELLWKISRRISLWVIFWKN